MLTGQRLKKEANLAFEDAINKEFEVRCDTIERLIFHTLLDTNEFILSNKSNERNHRTRFCIIDKHNLKDSSCFHADSLNAPVSEKDYGPAKISLARYGAHTIRETDLEAHMVFYRTQRLGGYVSKLVLKYNFDTVRLKTIFNKLLVERGIRIYYVLYFRTKDSTYNRSNFGPMMLAKFPVITRAYPTYKYDNSLHYVRAMFSNPFSYIINKLSFLLVCSLLLIIVISFSLFYLLKSLLTEQKLSLLKNDFISNITHELKTPIATVSAAIESLADFDVLDDPQRTKRYLQHSKTELKRLSSLVDTVLNSSLYENQQFDFNPQSFEVDQLMEHIVESYKFHRGKPVTLNYSNNSGLNAIYADSSLFQRVIGNIIDNAIKYSGDEVTIQLECKKQVDFFVINIKDNGIGIAKENLPYLFEKFYRVPAKTHAIKGHGLGLNYVKSIVERHDGWCRVESELNKGTTMILAWPI